MKKMAVVELRYRGQLDGEAAREAAAGCRVACTQEENKCRPEFLKQTLVSSVMQNVLPLGLPSGDVDFDLDLRQAFAAVKDARSAWFRVPKELREKYRTWDALFEAARTGELKPLEAAAASAAASSGSPSDSAAGVPPKGDSVS